MLEQPSPRQQEILDCIRRYTAEHGYPPTVREIGAAVGLASPNTVHGHLGRLERKGLLRREPGRSRAVVALDASEAQRC